MTAMVTGMEPLQLIAVPNSARRRTWMVDDESHSTVSALLLDTMSVNMDVGDYAIVSVEEKTSINGQFVI